MKLPKLPEAPQSQPRKSLGATQTRGRKRNLSQMEQSIPEETKSAKKTIGQKRQPDLKFDFATFEDTYRFKPARETPNQKPDKNLGVKKVRA